MNGRKEVSKHITLTYQTGAAPGEESTYKVAASLIEEIYTDSGGSLVSIADGQQSSAILPEVKATETPAAIANQTGQHILVTPSDGSGAYYFPIGRIDGLSDRTAYGRTGTDISYSKGNSTPLTLTVDETVATLIARVDAVAESAGRSTGSLVATGSVVGDAAAIVDDVTTVTTTGSGQGVVLPACTGYDRKTVVNNGPDLINLYATGSDTIEGVPGATGIQVPAGGAISIECVSSGSWRIVSNYALETFASEIYSLNRTQSIVLDGNDVEIPLPLIAGNKAIIPFEWDFAVLGGAVGTISLEARIPANAWVVDGFMEVVTTVQSGGAATFTLGHPDSVAGILNPVLVASLAAGGNLQALTVDGTVGNAAAKTTAEQPVNLVVNIAALTAGKVVGYLECLITE